MNNGFFAGIIIIIIIVFGGVIYYATDLSSQDMGLNDVENNNVKDINSVNNDKGINLNNKLNNETTSNKTVVAIQSAPANASEGSKIEITWAVKNDANSTITDVKGVDQNFNYTFGSLAPGESKSVNYSLYIPTINDLKSAGLDINNESMDEFFIGGFSLSYSMDDENYTINSNDINIILK